MSPQATRINYDAAGYLESLNGSKEWYERARLVEPAGVQGAGRYYPPRPVYIKKAKGSRIWDVDGHEYIDLHCSYGASFLGYNHDRVAAAVMDVLRNEGVLFAMPHPREVELAETLVRLIPSAEKVAFTAEGTTAMYHGVRAGRAYSGKPGVLKFEGAYHGWSDQVYASVTPALKEAGPAARPRATGGSAGRFPEALEHMYIAPWNDLEATRAIARENRDEIGVIIVEPVMRFIYPEPGFLEGIRALCNETGAVLLFDEIFSCFKAGLGCAQALFGVTPDITIVGKALANGFPLSCAVGKKEIMSLCAPEGPVFFSGTFNGALVSIRAGQETLRVMEEEKVPDVVNERGEEFARYLRDGIRRLGVPACVVHFRSVIHMIFTPEAPRSYRDVIYFVEPGPKELTNSYFHFMLANGVYIQPYYLVKMNLNYAHTRADLERTADLTLEWLKRNAAEVEGAAKAAVEASRVRS